jgi:D-hexose-6-phosphate mutarotase
VEEVRIRTGSNFYADLRIQNPVDRILFFADSLSKMGSSSKHLVELLLPIFEQWVDSKSTAVIISMFKDKDQKAEVLVMLQHASRKVKKALEGGIEKKKEEEQPVVEPEEVNLGEGVSISNAGMILCWPFFGRFFAAVGLVEQGKFKGQQAEERAVQLLQYLSTGLTSFEEWDLSLNKVLCGVPMNMPISPNLEITVEEEELVNKLINGTIFNWEKMRGTRLETLEKLSSCVKGCFTKKTTGGSCSWIEKRTMC